MPVIQLLKKLPFKRIILGILLLVLFAYLFVFILFLKTQRISLFNALNAPFINGYHAVIRENPEIFFKTMMPWTNENKYLREHLDNPSGLPEFDYEASKENLASNPLPYEMFYEFVTKENQESSSEWHWKNDMLVGQVLSWDSKQDLLGLSVTIPDSENQAWSSNKSAFRVQCEKKDSIVVGESLSLTTTFIDFLDEIEEGDRVYAFCLNKDCSAVGRSCVIARNE